MSRARTILLSLVVPLAGACDRRATAEPDAIPPSSSDAGSEAVAKPPPRDPNQPGPAYFALEERGVVRLAEDGTWTSMPGAPKPVRELLLGPDGHPHALTFAKLYRIEGDDFVEQVSFPHAQIGTVSKLAFGLDGDYWVATDGGVGHYSDGAWTLIPFAEIDPDISLLTGITAAADESVWIATSASLHRRSSSGKWAEVDFTSVDREPYFNALLTTPDGRAFAQAGDYLARLGAPDQLAKLPLSPSRSHASFFNLGVGAEGHVVLANAGCDVARVDPGDPPRTWFRAGDDHYGCEGLSAVGIDSQDRLWVASRAGLHVLGPDDDNHAYPSSTVPELIGNVLSLVVVGSGPALPEPGPIRKAGVSGKLMLAGKPVANAKLELCPYPAIFVRTTPCADAKIKLAGKADKQGSFTFTDLPIGNYQLAVEVAGNWQITWTADFGPKLVEGQIHAIGVVELSPPQ